MTSIYIDPEIAKYSRIIDVKGPALFIPLDRPEDELLVTGGQEPYAVILGGQWRGETFPLKVAENWEGMAVFGVTVQADLESAYAPDSEGKASLSLIRRGDSTSIFATSKNGGFKQTISVPLNDGADAPSDTRLGFKRWQIVLRHGDETKVLRTIEDQSNVTTACDLHPQ